MSEHDVVTTEFGAWLEEHDREVKRIALSELETVLAASPVVTVAGRGGALEMIRKLVKELENEEAE